METYAMKPFRAVSLFLTLVALLGMWTAPVGVSRAGGDQDDEAIRALVEAMTKAILNQDRDAYLALVDLSDPIFAREHTYWINDWATSAPLDRLSLEISDLQVAGDEATALLETRWATLPNTSYRDALYPVRFVRAEDGNWRYAGEAWITYEADPFAVKLFPGMEYIAEPLIAILPGIYDHAVESLDHDPGTIIEIKLYDSRDALGASVAFSLPPFSGWNEPGESLRMFVEEGELPQARVLAHELTHYLTFDMADTSYGQYPWWLMEGIAEYVASEYWSEERVAERWTLTQYWMANGLMPEWDQISNFEETPTVLWQFVYPLGFAFVSYVTEEYGVATRNDWLWDMAGEYDIDAATEDVFDMTFADLDAGFTDWLMAEER
jgi:hypothetical protein